MRCAVPFLIMRSTLVKSPHKPFVCESCTHQNGNPTKKELTERLFRLYYNSVKGPYIVVRDCSSSYIVVVAKPICRYTDQNEECHELEPR